MPYFCYEAAPIRAITPPISSVPPNMVLAAPVGSRGAEAATVVEYAAAHPSLDSTCPNSPSSSYSRFRSPPPILSSASIITTEFPRITHMPRRTFSLFGLDSVASSRTMFRKTCSMFQHSRSEVQEVEVWLTS